jgi:putative transposase
MHWQEREQRPKAYNDPGHGHGLTFTCFHRYRFLAKDRYCEWLAEAIEEARRELKYWVWAYVFMPEHVHLIVCPQDRVYDDSEFLKRVKEPVSRKAAAFLKRESPEWLAKIRVSHGDKFEHHFWQQGRGHDRNVDQTITLLQMIEYVHMNPIRRRRLRILRIGSGRARGGLRGRQ